MSGAARGRVRMIVCVNRRLGSGQRSCAGSGSLELIARLETLIAAAGLDVPVVRRECLGRCEEGPVMRIAPGGRFYTEIDGAALESILRDLRHFVEETKRDDG